MPIHTEKIFKDENNYILLSFYADNAWVISLTKVTKRKFWFDKEEQLMRTRFNKSLDQVEIINQFRDYAEDYIKEWK